MEMQQSPKIPFYVQRTFNEKMNASFDFIKENWKIMFKYITYLILPICLIHALSMNVLMDYSLSGKIVNSELTNLTSGHFVSYGVTMLCAVIGSLAMAALTYALMKLYNDREERLAGITFHDIKPLLFKNMGRLFILSILITILYVLIAMVIGLLALITPLTLIVTIPALIAVTVALVTWVPICLFEDIDFFAAFGKAFRMGFATWGGIFAVLFIMGIIASIVQSVLMTPWYAVTIIKMLFIQSSEGAASESTLLYNILIYILGVILIYGVYVSMIFSIIGISYQYAHASEKLDSVTVEGEIDNFENL